MVSYAIRREWLAGVASVWTMGIGTHSYYLGPRKSVVALGTWGEIESAATAGVLSEDQWVELKEAVPAKPGANLELAKDLASLSLDGGVLLIGLTDPKDALPEVVGATAEGLVTRITQVASGTIHPPLSITVDVVPNPDDPDRVVLVVSVPASLTAPHMVDGRYWGRGNEGKEPLSDAHVRMVLAARDTASDGFEARFAELRGELYSRDADAENNSHLYLLIEPARAGVGPTVQDVMTDTELHLFVLNAGPKGGSQAPPSLQYLSWMIAHPDGLLLDNEGNVAPLRVLVRADGAVAAFSGRASRGELAIPGYVATMTHQLVSIAARLARDHLGFNGQWQIGVLVDQLQDRRVSADYFAQIRYPQPEYRQLITASTAEMAEKPATVVSRLLSGFFRGFRWPESYAAIEDLNRA